MGGFLVMWMAASFCMLESDLVTTYRPHIMNGFKLFFSPIYDPEVD